ncbi:hypothetical protein NQ317_004416 [Molorchus minor]|uniref:BMERB domain-containing protein n=1 Tax=Molorchus minor TaxID=1323400 RepID=A0ABQ9IXZ8_9CUCU|nr:hypothetical protein NQ317_004416 [Molorchus minor]
MPHTRDVTPKAPPRQHRLHEDAGKTAEKLKQDARARARLLSNKELGLSPEEKLQRLKEKIISKRGKENENGNPLVQDGKESLVINSEKRNSWLYSNDTLSKKKNSLSKRSKSNDGMTSPKLTAYNNNVDDLGPVRTKSISDFPKSFSTICTDDEQNEARKMCKSDPNILEMEFSKPKKKSKDRERRKSITRLITTLFTKRSPSGSKGLFSKLSPKSKDKSKDVVVEEPARRKSLSEITVLRNFTTPPPVPPLPLNYSIKGTDGSSEGEHDWKKQDRSSCDTLDTQSGILENSMSSLSGRRSGKSARKVARQAQLKRHRMAQEIQRKLEETEVKTRELEMRGVLVEKALRGENKEESSKDEAELLQEWFDLMRDRTELHRYEKELSVRAKELELEDRHARLQHELRERLEKKYNKLLQIFAYTVCLIYVDLFDLTISSLHLVKGHEPKTEDDLKIEESIINEMMEIVDERDSIIASIEEDRLRCFLKPRHSAPSLSYVPPTVDDKQQHISLSACCLYSNEDRDLEEQMLVKGLRLTPIRKTPEK